LAVPDEVLLVALRLAKPGDTDADGDVDETDFRTLYRNYRTGTTWEQGDFNRDGTVNFSDFLMLEANLTGALPAGDQADLDSIAASVPEPAGAALLLLACIAQRRRRPSQD
jgi:hypothetical protein